MDFPVVPFLNISFALLNFRTFFPLMSVSILKGKYDVFMERSLKSIHLMANIHYFGKFHLQPAMKASVNNFYDISICKQEIQKLFCN